MQSNTLTLSIHRAPFVFSAISHCLCLIEKNLNMEAGLPLVCGKVHHCRVTLVLASRSSHRYKRHSLHSWLFLQRDPCFHPFWLRRNGLSIFSNAFSFRVPLPPNPSTGSLHWGCGTDGRALVNCADRTRWFSHSSAGFPFFKCTVVTKDPRHRICTCV